MEDAAKLQPNHEQVNLRLGLAYVDVGRGEDAYRSLLLVRRLHPENWAATVGLAVLHARAEQTDVSSELLADALATGGEPARALASVYPALASILSTRASGDGSD